MIRNALFYTSRQAVGKRYESTQLDGIPEFIASSVELSRHSEIEA